MSTQNISPERHDKSDGAKSDADTPPAANTNNTQKLPPPPAKNDIVAPIIDNATIIDKKGDDPDNSITADAASDDKLEESTPSLDNSCTKKSNAAAAGLEQYDGNARNNTESTTSTEAINQAQAFTATKTNTTEGVQRGIATTEIAASALDEGKESFQQQAEGGAPKEKIKDTTSSDAPNVGGFKAPIISLDIKGGAVDAVTATDLKHPLLLQSTIPKIGDGSTTEKNQTTGEINSMVTAATLINGAQQPAEPLPIQVSDKQHAEEPKVESVRTHGDGLEMKTLDAFKVGDSKAPTMSLDIKGGVADAVTATEAQQPLLLQSTIPKNGDWSNAEKRGATKEITSVVAAAKPINGAASMPPQVSNKQNAEDPKVESKPIHGDGLEMKTEGNTEKSSGEQKEGKSSGDKAAAAAAAASHTKRMRTRSLSSAMSSLSGGETMGDNVTFEKDNGKTPLRTNTSHGPVRKRHKKKGPRALFRSNNNTEQPSASTDLPSQQPPPVESNGSTSDTCVHENNNLNKCRSRSNTIDSIKSDTMLHPPMQNNESPLVTFATSNDSIMNNRRSRSNTIDSFRAAMECSSHASNDLFPTESLVLPERREEKEDDHLLHLPTESIVLPEMKKESKIEGDDDGDDAKKVEDIISSKVHDTTTFKHNSLPALSMPRNRSDTIDFLKASNIHLATQRDRSDTMEFFKGSSINLTSPRSRSDTIDFLNASNNPLASPRGRATGGANNLLISPSRRRSDTLDYLTGADSGSGIMKAPTIGIDSLHKTSEDHNLPLPSPRVGGRARSDTIDFLTNHVEFQVDDNGTAVGEHEVHPTPINVAKEMNSGAHQTQKRVEITLPAAESSTNSNNYSGQSKSHPKDHHGIAFGKTPKKTNLTRSRVASHSSESTMGQGPLRKRHRTRSLSFAAKLEQAPSSPKPLLPQPAVKNPQDDESTNAAGSGVNEDDIPTESDVSGGARSRSNTLDSFHIHNAVYGGGRQRSDTMDFLTAAVAGDMGHNLDAAMAAAADDGASFAMHTVSAPSGASTKYKPSPPSRRPRSNTLDSTTSSINSAKLDFLVSIAAEQGVLHDHHDDPESNMVRERSGSQSGASENSSGHHPIQRRPRSNTLEIFSNMASTSRSRSDTVDFLIGGHEGDPVANIDDVVVLDHDEHDASGNVMDHLKALCDEPKVHVSKKRRILGRKRRDSTDIADGAMERNRLESWGGMSELSAGMGQITATHSALRDTGILDDVLAAVADLGDNSSFERLRRQRTGSGGSTSLSGLAAPTAKKGRPRVDSLASLSLASLSDTSVSISGPKNLPREEVKTQGKKPADSASISTPSIVVDYNAIAAAVSAANTATEGLDLAAIMGTPTSKAQTRSVNKPTVPTKMNTTKLSGPLPKSYVPQAGYQQPIPGRVVHPKTVTKLPTAATAASNLQKAKLTPQAVSSGANGVADSKSPVPFPVTSINIPFVPIPKSTKTKEEMDAIRERARAAAGYVPPSKDGKTPAKRPLPPPRRATPASTVKYNPQTAQPPYRPRVPPHVPMKKRCVPLPHPPRTPLPDHIRSTNAKTPLSYRKPPTTTPSSNMSSKSGTLQSNQKWEDMFDCLVKFIKETREKSTQHMDEAQKSAWIWDGNVPTSYKTPCGKALGRWINNQRSAKAKGTLKDDREVRLVSTGLKWSVLTTNSWRQMLRELEIYVHEQTKDGRPWDGNVPTNYKIKSSTPSGNPGPEDDEKNLGRWVNRQRSLFQAGKLKKDRQRDLERVGLKWSVLLTTSWSTMYDSLCAYAEERRQQGPHGWDGNVPANFKTRTNPPLSLGRWINRQRTAHAKGRLKEEYVHKLEAIGLKWVIHVRSIGINDGEEYDEPFIGGEFIQSNPVIQTTNTAHAGVYAAASGQETTSVATADPAPVMSVSAADLAPLPSAFP